LVDLGEGFRQKQWPKFTGLGRGEHGLAVRKAWNVIINHDLLPTSGDAESKPVDALIAWFLCYKELSDEIHVCLCNRLHYCNKCPLVCLPLNQLA